MEATEPEQTTVATETPEQTTVPTETPEQTTDTTVVTLNDIAALPVIVPPPPISLRDILSSIEVITQKEKDDKASLEALGSMSYDTLKTKLVAWATLGFPNVYELERLTINPPSTCSDGVSRNLTDYVQFCSGKSMQEHIANLQQRVQDMLITFANMGSYIAVLVSKV